MYPTTLANNMKVYFMYSPQQVGPLFIPLM